MLRSIQWFKNPLLPLSVQSVPQQLSVLEVNHLPLAPPAGHAAAAGTIPS